MNEQHLRTFVNRQTNQTRNDYWMHLNASIDCVQFLLKQGLAFRSHDESNNSTNKAKEQMAIVIRYVDKNGHAVEHILGIVHVTDTSALSLKAAIDALFSKHSLSISRLRGQGYDGASNMRGEFNGLKTLVLKENGSAFYVH
ncbi:hypothetical protein P3X46_034067 [Hevea brasiliensis]|uniref:DUF4371 domain-containing protein n=1 Tax=Hevea brasiliensis TaxID=3981 RepID=A0ABQ9K991_HEVBR|nr:hypothetical protein P3X46_034067 [Hevea brasiliensis]